jgi:hypothetical protein
MSAPEETVEGTAAELDPDDFKPAPAELAVADVAHPEADVFRVLDRHDEAQILEEMQSRVLDVTLYDFPGEGGSRQVDLSYKGVREVIHLMTRTGKVRIRVIPGSLSVVEVFENGEPHYVADVWAEDTVTGEAYSGSSSQPKLMKLTDKTAKKWRAKGRDVPDDRKVWDSFARTKAINKAERNALGKFVPEPLRQVLIAQYLKDPKRIDVIRAGAGAEQMAELPPPLADERADAQRAEARELYDRIKGFAPGGVAVGLTPAAFNQWMTRTEHSHERLDDFLTFLRGKLEEAEKGAES